VSAALLGEILAVLLASDDRGAFRRGEIRIRGHID
jgi:hypothetical protein